MTEASTLDDAGGDRQHVLHRAAQRHAHDIVGPVGPEHAGGERGGEVAAEGGIGGGDADRRRQALHRLLREARAREHGDGPAWQHLGQHLGHQQAARGLDALGADHDGTAAGQVVRHDAQRLGRTDQQDRIAVGELGELRCGVDAGVERLPRQVDLVATVVRDRGRYTAITRPERHRATGPAGETGQRRSPGAAADDADMRDAHHAIPVTG